MRTPDKIAKKCEQWTCKYNIAWLIVILAYIICRKNIITIINNVLVKNYNLRFNSNWSLVFCILIIIILFLYLYPRYKKRYIISKELYKTTFFLCLFYADLRFFANKWDFHPVGYPICYSDIIILIFIATITLFLKYRKPTKSNSEPYFLHDSPIEKAAEDILKYDSITKDIATEINKIELGNSFSIGITKKWGNGKTSFLNLLQNHIEEKDPNAIIIKFSPWYSNSPREIILNYIKFLSENIGNYHSSLNNQLAEYYKLIVSIENNSITKYIDKGIKPFKGDSDIEKTYQKVNTTIQEMNRKVYVIIDDIDRLMPDEIIECLKIIRNTADFKNVIYISAYDSKYVEVQLSKKLKQYSKVYIDKIVQLEFNLPEIDILILQQYIKDELLKRNITQIEIENIFHRECNKNNLSSSFFDDLYDDDKSQHIQIIQSLNKFITNLRDCNKILNNFITYKAILKSEIDISDLFLVCVLKSVYPSEALELYNNLERYFILGRVTTFRDSDESLGNPNNDKPKHKPSEIHNLNKSKEFINLISAIFLKHKPSIKSAAVNENYKIYYNGVNYTQKITYNDLEQYIISSNTLILKLDELLNNKSIDILDELSDKLIKFTPSDKDKAQIIIHSLLYLGNKIEDRNFSNVIYSNLSSFKKDAIQILTNIIETPYNLSLLHIGNHIREIIFNYIHNEKNPDYDLYVDIPDGKKEFHKLALKLLYTKIKEGTIDNSLMAAHYNCCNDVDENNKIIIDVEANEKLRDFVTQPENAPKFIKILIIYDFNIDTGKQHPCFIAFLDQLFSDKIGDFKPFEDFLNKTISENPEDEDLKEIGEQWKTVDTTQRTLFIKRQQ